MPIFVQLENGRMTETGRFLWIIHVHRIKMNYMELLNSIPPDLKSKFRKLENLRTKLINNSWSNIFNEVCLNFYLNPVLYGLFCLFTFYRKVFILVLGLEWVNISSAYADVFWQLYCFLMQINGYPSFYLYLPFDLFIWISSLQFLNAFGVMNWIL